MNWIKNLFSIFNRFITRPGLDVFVNRWQGIAVQEIIALSQVNSNASFHEWREQAQGRLKTVTGELKDNWIAILISLAFEEAKARKIVK